MKFDREVTIPHKVFFNDMSKNYMCEEFKTCDVVYSEISWLYGYNIFNERAQNSPSSYAIYLDNIARLIHELRVPSFIICGKNVRTHFSDANINEITINTANIKGDDFRKCILYTWYYDCPITEQTSSELIETLSNKYNKCLDFSCGYGTHLLRFNDFVGTDIDKNCLTYLSLITGEKDNV